MMDDANIDRIKKRMESLMDDIKELANIAAECLLVVWDSKNICNRNNDKDWLRRGFIIAINGT